MTLREEGAAAMLLLRASQSVSAASPLEANYASPPSPPPSLSSPLRLVPNGASQTFSVSNTSSPVEGGCGSVGKRGNALSLSSDDWLSSMDDEDARLNNILLNEKPSENVKHSRVESPAAQHGASLASPQVVRAPLPPVPAWAPGTFESPGGYLPPTTNVVVSPYDADAAEMASGHVGMSITSSVLSGERMAQMKQNIKVLEQRLARERQELHVFHQIQKRNAAMMRRKKDINVDVSSMEYKKGVSLLKPQQMMFYSRQHLQGTPAQTKRKAVTLDPSALGALPPANLGKTKRQAKKQKKQSGRQLRKGRGRTCAYSRPTHVKQQSAKTYKLHEAGDDKSIPRARSKMADWEKRVTQGQWDRLPTDCPRCRGQGGAKHTWTKDCRESQGIRNTVLKPHYRAQILKELREKKAKAKARQAEEERVRQLNKITVQPTKKWKRERDSLIAI